MVIINKRFSILSGEHSQLSRFFEDAGILAFIGPMASEKTMKLISRLYAFKSFADQSPPKEEIVITGIKNKIDNRVLIEEGAFIESRIGKFPAIVTSTPFDWIKQKYSKEKVFVLGISDAQFFPYQQMKDLIEFTKKKRNIHLIIEGLNLNFRGEPFAHSDFKGTMYTTLSLIPRQNISKLTAFCNYCGNEGAEYTVRWFDYSGTLKPVPVYDRLVRVGSDSLENNGNDEILGIKNPKISYGACHEDEFIEMQKQSKIYEWLAVYNTCKLSSQIGEFSLEYLGERFSKLMPERVFQQIIRRFLEEKIITFKGLEERVNEILTNPPSEAELNQMMTKKAYWIKKY